MDADAICPSIAQAAARVRQSDVPVVVVRTYESGEVDRPGLRLPNEQDELIHAVAAANSCTIT